MTCTWRMNASACTGLRLVVGVLYVLCVGGFSGPAVSQERPPARALFKDGVDAFKAKRFRRAIDIFRRLFEVDPNPYALFNIGRSLEELGDIEGAVNYYQRSLAIRGLPRKAKLDAVRRLEALEPSLIKRKTFRIARTSASVRIDRGVHMAMRELKLPDAHGTTRIVVERYTPGPAPPSASRAWAVGALVAGGLALGVGGYSLSVVLDKRDKQDALIDTYRRLGVEALVEKSPSKAQVAIRTAEASNRLSGEIRAAQVWTGVLLVSGALMTLGGAVTLGIDLFSEDPQMALRIRPTLGGLMAQGRW